MKTTCIVCGREVRVDPNSRVIGNHAQGESPDVCPTSGSKLEEHELFSLCEGDSEPP